MRLYKLYTGSAVSANNACSVQVLKSGIVQMVNFSTAFEPHAAVSSGRLLEVSLIPTVQVTTHDTQGQIAMISEVATYQTAVGWGQFGTNVCIPVSVAVTLGMLVYLNQLLVGTTPLAWAHANVYLWVKE